MSSVLSIPSRMRYRTEKCEWSSQQFTYCVFSSSVDLRSFLSAYCAMQVFPVPEGPCRNTSSAGSPSTAGRRELVSSPISAFRCTTSLGRNSGSRTRASVIMCVACAMIVLSGWTRFPEFPQCGTHVCVSCVTVVCGDRFWKVRWREGT